MKKLLIIATLMLALVITAVACTDDPVEPDSIADTTVENPTEAPTDEPDDPEETTALQDEETTASNPEETTAGAEETEPETEPDPEPTVTLNKTEYAYGESIMVSATGSNKDWVGIVIAGTDYSIRWWYVADVGEGVAIDALNESKIQAGTGDATGALPAGEYEVVWVANDSTIAGAAKVYRYKFTVKDPSLPVWIMDADALAGMTNANGATVEKNEAGYASFNAVGGDPWFLMTGNIGAMPEYLVFRYRTNTTQQGEIFIGNGAGPVGGESFSFTYNSNGEWNLMIFHLPTVASYMADPTVGYIRYDFYTGGPEEGAFLDVAYFAFFNSAEYAQAYDFEMYKAPVWNESGFILHHSFDELDKYAGEAKVEGVFTPGQAASWDGIVNLPDFSVDTLRYWGWVAATGGLGQFGYQVNGGAPIYDDAWTYPDPGLEPHMPAGHDHFTRMAVMISLDGLDGENNIRVLYKNAEGKEACLGEFTVTLPVKPKDIENTFASDISSVAAGTALNSTDLTNYFTAALNLGQYLSVDGAYVMDGISEIYADVNGRYALTVDFADGSNGAYAAIVRGVHAVNSTQGEMKINNFYETDGAGFGGAGIYACVINGNLKLTVKTFDPSITTCVKNVEYNLPCTGNKLTMADDGETVYVMVDGVVYATFAISGSVEYPAENISLVSPATTFAETVVVSLIDGTTETLTNTLVDSTCETQIALAVRGGSFNFSSVKVEGFSAVEIPEFEIPDVPPVVTESIPMESWTVTGHAAGLTSKDKEGIGGMVAAGGLNVGALLHQGSVGLGELDLSKYSKVIIKYGIDNGPTTIEKHTANGTNRIMLTTADNNMTMTPGGDVLAYVDYTPNGWSLMSIEIDLTAVDYNGNVFLTWDTLDGTFMLIGSVEFVCIETPEA